MSPRVDQIIKELPMYEKAEDVGTFFKLHDTVIHELHIELDGVYNTLTKEEIESDIKELESCLTEVIDHHKQKLESDLTEVTDHHKKELLHEIIAYIEKKV